MRHREIEGADGPGGGSPDPAPAAPVAMAPTPITPTPIAPGPTEPASERGSDVRNGDAHGSTAVAWALHALEPAEEIEFLAHLDRCPVCPRVVAEVTTTLGVLGRGVPEEEPPPGLRGRILDAARADVAPAPRVGSTPRARFTRSVRPTTPGAFWGPVTSEERIADVIPLSRQRPAPDRERRAGTGAVASGAVASGDGAAVSGSGASGGGASGSGASGGGASGSGASGGGASGSRASGAAVSGGGASGGGASGGGARPSRRSRGFTRGIAVAASLAVVASVAGLVATDRALERSRTEAAAASTEAAAASTEAESANAAASAAAAAAGRSDQVVRVLAAAGAPGARHATLATPSGDLVGLVVDTDGGPELVTTGLAGNAANRTYVLWGLASPDAAPTGLGAFDVPGADPSARSVPSGPDQPFAAYAVSLEPGRSVPRTPTDVVASGQVTQ